MSYDDVEQQQAYNVMAYDIQWTYNQENGLDNYNNEMAYKDYAADRAFADSAQSASDNTAASAASAYASAANAHINKVYNDAVKISDREYLDAKDAADWQYLTDKDMQEYTFSEAERRSNYNYSTEKAASDYEYAVRKDNEQHAYAVEKAESTYAHAVKSAEATQADAERSIASMKEYDEKKSISTIKELELKAKGIEIGIRQVDMEANVQQQQNKIESHKAAGKTAVSVAFTGAANPNRIAGATDYAMGVDSGLIDIRATMTNRIAEMKLEGVEQAKVSAGILQDRFNPTYVAPADYIAPVLTERNSLVERDPFLEKDAPLDRVNIDRPDLIFKPEAITAGATVYHGASYKEPYDPGYVDPVYIKPYQKGDDYGVDYTDSGQATEYITGQSVTQLPDTGTGEVETIETIETPTWASNRTDPSVGK